MTKLSAHWKKIQQQEGLRAITPDGVRAAKILMAHKNWWKQYRKLQPNMTIEQVAMVLEAGDPDNDIKSYVGYVIESEGILDDED